MPLEEMNYSSPRYSEYKGVTWDSSKGLWRAEVAVDSRKEELGTFISARRAARAYDERARELGRTVNFPLAPPSASSPLQPALDDSLQSLAEAKARFRNRVEKFPRNELEVAHKGLVGALGHLLNRSSSSTTQVPAITLAPQASEERESWQRQQAAVSGESDGAGPAEPLGKQTEAMEPVPLERLSSPRSETASPSAEVGARRWALDELEDAVLGDDDYELVPEELETGPMEGGGSGNFRSIGQAGFKNDAYVDECGPHKPGYYKVRKKI